MFEAGFRATQSVIAQNLISAGHDVSDGGLITTLLEMAFAGNCGLSVNIPSCENAQSEDLKGIQTLFAEELGLVLEVKNRDVDKVLSVYREVDVPCFVIGKTGGVGDSGLVSVSVNGSVVLEDKMVDLRDVWEATSFQLERLQTNPRCVVEEEAGLRGRKAPPYKINFEPSPPKAVDVGE